MELQIDGRTNRDKLEAAPLEFLQPVLESLLLQERGIGVWIGDNLAAEVGCGNGHGFLQSGIQVLLSVRRMNFANSSGAQPAWGQSLTIRRKSRIPISCRL